MRPLLTLFGLVSLVCAAADAAIAVLLALLVLLGRAPAGASVLEIINDHLPALFWIRELADRVFPEPVHLWILAAPALFYFPVRIIFGLLMGAAALAAATGTPR